MSIISWWKSGSKQRLINNIEHGLSNYNVDYKDGDNLDYLRCKNKADIIGSYIRFFLEGKFKDVLNLQYTSSDAEVQKIIDDTIKNAYNIESVIDNDTRTVELLPLIDLLINFYNCHYIDYIRCLLVFNNTFDLPRQGTDNNVLGYKIDFVEKNVDKSLVKIFRPDFATKSVLLGAVELYVDFLLAHKHYIKKGTKLVVSNANISNLSLEEMQPLSGDKKNEVIKEMTNVLNSEYKDVLYLSGLDIRYIEKPQGSYGDDLLNEYEMLQKNIAVALRTPVTKLFGGSPDGMNATGEGDYKNYQDELLSQGNIYVKPILTRVCELILNRKGIDIEVSFRLHDMNEDDL